MEEFNYSFTEGKKKYFAIKIKQNKNIAAVAKLLKLKENPGWIIEKDGVSEWYFKGITYKNDDAYIYGEFFKGISLEDVLAEKAQDAMIHLNKMIDGLIKLREKKISAGIYLNSVFFTNDDKVIFLPKKLMDKLKDLDLLESYDYSLINNPYLNEENQAISYSILALFYRILSDKFPFEAESEDEINNLIRNSEVIPPSLVDPEIKKVLSDYVYSSFKTGIYKNVSLEDWRIKIDACIEEGITQDLSQKEKEEYKVQAYKWLDLSEKRFRWNQFIEKNKKNIFLIPAVTLLAFIIVFSFARNYFKPRITKGFSPEKVVETFYASMNSLDHATMSDCVIKNAGKNDIDETMMIFLTSKQVIFFEGKSNVIPVEKWIKDGKPPVIPPQYVYGVSNLIIVKTKDEPAPVFTVEYEKWGPVTSDGKNGETTLNFKGYKRKDLVNLKKAKDDWVIYKIDRAENLEIKN